MDRTSQVVRALFLGMVGGIWLLAGIESYYAYAVDYAGADYVGPFQLLALLTSGGVFVAILSLTERFGPRVYTTPARRPYVRHVPISTVLLVAVIGASCGNTLAPTLQAEAVLPSTPAHHNIIATFVGHEDGPLVWLCATQPRGYWHPDGTRTWEEDHYLQYSVCPTTPIQ